MFFFPRLGMKYNASLSISQWNEVIQMKDEVIKAKYQEIKNLKYEVTNGRRHRFSPTTEDEWF